MALHSPSISTHSLSTPLSLSLSAPPDAPVLTFLSLSLCTPPADFLLPSILTVANSSAEQHQASLHAGVAQLSLINSQGLTITIQPASPPPLSSTFQLTLATHTAIHNTHPFPALKLDDSDSNSALLTAADNSLFLPRATPAAPSLREFLPIILPTPDSLQLGLANSLCYLQSLIASQPTEAKAALAKILIEPSLTTRTTGIGSFSSQPSINASDHDYRISDAAAGLRTQYRLSNLAPASNYSVWLFQPGPLIDNIQTGNLWPYITFRTKSTKNCRLVHDLPFCPSIAYAVPAPPSQPTSELVQMYNRTVSGHLANFRTLVSSYPCNNDTSGRYSFVSGCGDCLRAYTDWACAMTMPRCVDPPPSPSPSSSSSSSSSSSETQIVFTRPSPADSRTPNLTDPSVYPYSELPPCPSLCTLVAATCPPLVGWTCPLPQVSLTQAYALPRTLGARELAGGQASLAGAGGLRAQDRFGNVFCNALESDIVYARIAAAIPTSPPPATPLLALLLLFHLLRS